MGWNERSDPDMRTANFKFSCDVYREGVYSSTLNKQNKKTASYDPFNYPAHNKMSHDLTNWCFITNIFTAHSPH